MAKNGPNGTASFMPLRDCSMTAKPERVPTNEDTKIVNTTPFQPTRAPIIASNLMSPPPMPSFFGDQAVDPGDQEQAAAPNKDTQKCCLVCHIRQGETGCKADGYAGQGDDIGYNSVIQIDEGHYQQTGNECKIN